MMRKLKEIRSDGKNAEKHVLQLRVHEGCTIMLFVNQHTGDFVLSDPQGTLPEEKLQDLQRNLNKSPDHVAEVLLVLKHQVCSNSLLQKHLPLFRLLIKTCV